MTSRQRSANCSHARASTGPKTAAGRARVWRNARRHGLAARNRIAGGVGAPNRGPQSELGGSDSGTSNSRGADRSDLDTRRPPAPHRAGFERRGPLVLSDVAKQLRALDRYARRALSRRYREELGRWHDCNQLLLHPTCVIFLERCLYRYRQVQNFGKRRRATLNCSIALSNCLVLVRKNP